MIESVTTVVLTSAFKSHSLHLFIEHSKTRMFTFLTHYPLKVKIAFKHWWKLTGCIN